MPARPPWWRGWPRGAAAAAAALLTVWSAGSPALARSACGPQALADGIVQAVPEPLTLALADGRLIRLDGIEVPQLPSEAPGAAPDIAEDPDSDPEDFAGSALAPPAAARSAITPQGSARTAAAPAGAPLPEVAARRFLEAALIGRTVAMRTGGSGPDRYGRLRAYVFAKPQSLPTFADAEGWGLEGSVQHALLTAGTARVAARVGELRCASDLWALEQRARRARSGIWAQPGLAVLASDDPAAVLRHRGRMVVVEGRVVSVRESGATVYVNFGRRWSEDFTVTIARRHLRRLASAGFEPRTFERRRVRVRGWVEERGGPWIDLVHPEQIELVSP